MRPFASHAVGANSSGCEFTTFPRPVNTGLNQSELPTGVRLADCADNGGCLPVSAYRGIGSETVRRPVVSIGRDPNKMQAGSWLHTGKPMPKVSEVSPWMLSAVSPPGN